MNNDSQTTTIHGKLEIKGSTSASSVNASSITIGQVQLYWQSSKNVVIVYNAATNTFSSIGGGSQTITHVSNVVGELGTFCETTGTIYDGYDKISNTDCICAVKQATLLNKKIVGIITNEDEFASHGDVLVKIAPGTVAEIGDILCPDENGYGRVATEDELIFMMMYAIPRPKITCLDTGIDGYVACFIV